MISVIGGNNASSCEISFAAELGSLLAQRGFSVVCGGGGGVMEAAAGGCSSQGGLTLGILPGDSPCDSNRFVDIAVPTGIGFARNRMVVLTGRVVCAVGGSHGTLSEIAFALQAGRPVCCHGTWSGLPGVVSVQTPGEALEFVLKNTEE